MKIFFRNLIVFSVIAILSTLHLAAQSPSLERADSLYKSQKYTEAFRLYEDLFEAGFASPAMLVRMSYIKEGLGDYVSALYYLNLYYQMTSNKKALTKMREIAKEHQLEGYAYSDAQFIAGIIYKYRNIIILVLMSISLWLTAYIFRKKRQQEKPGASVAFQMITAVGLLILINGFFTKEHAIIKNDRSLLMAGPSAGAEPIRQIAKGHKVVLLEKDDVWSKIIWDDRKVFIRNTNIQML